MKSKESCKTIRKNKIEKCIRLFRVFQRKLYIHIYIYSLYSLHTTQSFTTLILL